MSYRIDITGVDLRKFIKEVYELSKAQGLGFVDFKKGGLSEEDVDKIIKAGKGSVYMDYVNGRACKMRARLEDGRLTIPSEWYDHSDYLLGELLKRCGITWEPK